jgi:hypothetical protein
MAIAIEDLKKKVARFKASIAADLYSPSDIVDFSAANAALAAQSAEISAVAKILEAGDLNLENLSRALTEYPKLYGLLCSLLAIASSIELEDGRRVPAPYSPPRDSEAIGNVSALLLELGISKLLHRGSDFYALLLVVQIASEAPRRRLRVDTKLLPRIKRLLESSLASLNSASEQKFTLGSTQQLPDSMRRIVDHLVLVDGKPLAAIATTFQAHTGGRQTREFTALYPGIQATLERSGITLLLIADGQGTRNVSDRALTQLFDVVPFTMSLSQAEDSGLHDALASLAANPRMPSVDLAGLERLIDGALMNGSSVNAAALPVPEVTARLALATFASSNSKKDLQLSSDGKTIAWKKSALVERFRKAPFSTDRTNLVNDFITLVGAESHGNATANSLGSGQLASMPGDSVFVAPFFVAARIGQADASALRDLAKHALQIAPTSRVAVLIVSTPLTSLTLSVLRDAQALLPVTVVVLDVATCLSMARARTPARDRLREIVLQQTDLTKLSPFVVRGVTPSRVFFGREEEEATLLSTLSTNSVALLGGRRIGKTSLMRHCFDRLVTADFQPFFGDCQVVRTWADFGVMASRNWSVSLPSDFKPQHLFELVDKLRNQSTRHLVFLLDEIDQILDWDLSHSDDQVPEAFFRACRSISQQGIAQFVFSGERTIAQRLWDASSPHWNFCRPLLLQQLTEKAARDLIIEPLTALGVSLIERDLFIEKCWSCTDGHPELLQFLGDKVVGLINQRDRQSIIASPADVNIVANQYEFAEQYLETYWGQASALERLISIQLIDGPSSVDQISTRLEGMGIHRDTGSLQSALRMLELYGIAKLSLDGYTLRAQWFPTALSFYGGPARTAELQLSSLKS